MFDQPRSAADAPSGGSAVTRARLALVAAADALAALQPGELADAMLSECLQDWDGEFNRIDAARAALVGVWDARTVWAVDAAQSGAGWMAAHTELSRPAASGQIRLARALRTMPVVQAAYTTGVLGVAKTRLLADAAAEAPETFAEHEATLVEQVIGLRVDQAARLLAFWKAHANPDGAEDQEAKNHADRAFHLSETFKGMWLTNGKLTGHGGEIVAAELDRRAKSMYKAEKRLADANGTTVETTAAQRRADALIEIVLQAMTAGEDGNSMNVPAITAIIRIDELADPDVQPTDVVGETEHGHPVTAATALRWTCDCSISRVILDPNSVPVDLGMTARLPSPAQRRALAARDQGCCFPGCDRHAGWTTAHHLIHWIKDGPTDLQNMALLCVFHHHRVHEGKFGIRRLPSGALEFTRPDGTLLNVPKGRAPNPTWPNTA